jgi:hypothetical protein
MSVTGDHVQVSSADLMSHAGQINGIGDGLTTAQQAGTVVRTDSGAYGKLCHIVPAQLNVVQDQVIDGIAAAAKSAHETADALRLTATDLITSSETNTCSIRTARAQWGALPQTREWPRHGSGLLTAIRIPPTSPCFSRSAMRRNSWQPPETGATNGRMRPRSRLVTRGNLKPRPGTASAINGSIDRCLAATGGAGSDRLDWDLGAGAGYR